MSASRSLIDLPPELLEDIVVNLSDAPFSIASLAKTCTMFYSLIFLEHDHHLWRRLFLARYDDPRQTDYLHRCPFDSKRWRLEFVALVTITKSVASETDKLLGIPSDRFTTACGSLARSCTAAQPLDFQVPEDSPKRSTSLSGDIDLIQAYKRTSRHRATSQYGCNSTIPKYSIAACPHARGAFWSIIGMAVPGNWKAGTTRHSSCLLFSRLSRS